MQEAVNTRKQYASGGEGIKTRWWKSWRTTQFVESVSRCEDVSSTSMYEISNSSASQKKTADLSRHKSKFTKQQFVYNILQ